MLPLLSCTPSVDHAGAHSPRSPRRRRVPALQALLAVLMWLGLLTLSAAQTLSGSVSSTPANCFGSNTGSATASVTGGTPPYSYIWSPRGGTAATATGLTAGDYSVRVTDSVGASLDLFTTVTQPPPLLVSVVGTDASTFGGSDGSATATASGGTAPYSYLWSPFGSGPTLSGLAAGTYSVSVTDFNACSAQGSVVIGQPTPPTISTAMPTSIRARSAVLGGTVTSEGSTAVSERGVVFSRTQSTPTLQDERVAMGSGQGSFADTVTLEPNSTYAVRAYAISPAATVYGATRSFSTPSELFGTIAVVNGVACFGGSNGRLRVNASGGVPPYSYLWSPGGSTAVEISGRPAGSYSVQVSDAIGQSLSLSTVLTQPPQLRVDSILSIETSSPQAFDGRLIANVSGGTPPYFYSWSPAGGTGATTGLLGVGTYTVNVGDDFNCATSASESLRSAAPAGAPEVDTAPAANIAQTSAQLGGAVVAEGDAPVSERGLVYSTSRTPTVLDTRVALGSGIGTFATTVSGLQPGALYYVRAYATNTVGTRYGSQQSFRTVATPAAPLIGIATPDDGAATLAFTPPAESGGSAISGYVVQVEPGGRELVCSGPPCRIDALQNGSSYAFRAIAVNAAGRGPASELSNSVIPAGVPGVPTGLRAVASNGAAELRFLPPADTGGSPLTGYAIEILPSGDTRVCAAAPCRIEGLQNQTAYRFTVAAINTARTGPASAPSNAVTPASAGAELVLSAARASPANAAASRLEYRIHIDNHGPDAVQALGARLPLLLGLGDVLWSCSGAAPDACTPNAGGPPVSTALALAAGESAVITLSGVPSPEALFIEFEARLDPPAGLPLNGGHLLRLRFIDAADERGLLRSGFE